MGSFHRNCEIVEVKDEPNSSSGHQTLPQIRGHERVQRPPIVKKGSYKSLENDINKLFEAVDLRTCKSLDLSDSWRNSSKKPMRGSGSNSPGIGFSEPVSLKQALRGLCISQAAETAALKRLSLPPASPRISEIGKISNLSRSVVIGNDESGCSSQAEGSTSDSRVKVPSKLENGTLRSYEMAPCRSPKTKSTIQSSSQYPRFGMKPTFDSVKSVASDPGQPQAARVEGNVSVPLTRPPKKSAKSVLPHDNLPGAKTKSPNRSVNTSPRLRTGAVIQGVETSTMRNSVPNSGGHKHLPETASSKEEKHRLAPIMDRKISSSNNVAIGPCKEFVPALKVVNKESTKMRRKSRLQNIPSSSMVKSNKDVKSIRKTSRTVKPVIGNKSLVIKKSMKASVPDDGNPETSHKVNGDLEYSSGNLICERCECLVKDTCKDSKDGTQETVEANVFTESGNCDEKKTETIPSSWGKRVASISKTNTASKSCEKGDISQSSKSSICDFSSSTSLSEDSNFSGSSCGNRPHMSKDVRWGAISSTRKRHGFIGLNHFNLLKKLGSGDIGTVYLAELVGANCFFAIKVMDNEFLARRKKSPRAQTEREILRILDHPFLPTLYAQFTSDNLSCLVMEFCPGGDLHVLRQKQPSRCFPEQAARFYVAEVLLALEYLHMLGIIYRDLKPENILVREDGHIMLTDFDLSLRCSVSPTLMKSSILMLEPPRISGPCAGSNCIDPFCTGPSCKVSCFSPGILPGAARARKLKVHAAAPARLLPQLVAEPTEARSNSFVGTHEYLAPEIVKGDGHGSAVDWWTLGVFLYELLYGQTPFKGAENEETLTNVVLQNLQFPDAPMVSFQARDLIQGLLAKEPENRLGTETGAAEIKRHPFFEGLNWALIRCVIPPLIPEFQDVRDSKILSQERERRYFEYSSTADHLEFELF